MDKDKAIRAAKLTLGGMLEKRRAKTAVERAQGQIAPSKYLPDVPRQVHADGGKVSDGVAAAETVAGMLRDGREKEITNDHLEAADPQHLWKLYETGQTGMDLPMDSASRMDRAKAMGMSHEGYHSSLSDLTSFKPTGKFMGHKGTSGISTTDNPKVATRYLDRFGNFDYKGKPFDKNVMKTVADLGKVTVQDRPYPTSPLGPYMGDPLPSGYTPEHVRRGFDTAQFPDEISTKGSVRHSGNLRSTETIMSDPAKIRSVFARFDPRLAHLSHLNAATGGRVGHANGGYVPAAALPVGRLAVAGPLPIQRQPGLLDALGSLASIGKSATGIADLVSPEKEEAPKPHADRVEARAEGLTPEATAAMEALRKGWTGQDFGIVSGYRTPEENRAAKGAKDSQHTHGNAFDVNTTGWSPEEKLALADAAWDAGFRGFGFYDNNMHFDVADPRAWGPSHSRDSIPDWAQGWASQRYGYADGGEVTDLGQAREQKQLQTFHTGVMDDIHTRMTHAMEAHQKAVDAGVFDGYEVGDTLQGSAHPMRITGRYMQAWKPTTMALRSFERMGTDPTIIEHEGKQYIPMLRYQTGKEGVDGFQEGTAYLDGVRAAGYQKMGGLRAVKARGGAVATKTKDGSEIFGNGALIHRYTHPETGGYIDVLQRPQGPASVLGLEVPEEHRGKGIGQMLQAEALERHPALMGQVSSKAAATTAYRLGRRPYGAPDATLDDVFSTIDSDSSVNMLSPQAQPKADGGEVDGDDKPIDLASARAARNQPPAPAPEPAPELVPSSARPPTEVEGMFNRLAEKRQKSQMAYDAAKADGIFEKFPFGDVYKYKHSPNPSPMTVIGHRMLPVEAWGGLKPPKYVYHNHYPVLDMDAGNGEINPYPVELMEDKSRYDWIKGKPRAVKKRGGALDAALALTRRFTKR